MLILHIAHHRIFVHRNFLELVYMALSLFLGPSSHAYIVIHMHWFVSKFIYYFEMDGLCTNVCTFDTDINSFFFHIVAFLHSKYWKYTPEKYVVISIEQLVKPDLIARYSSSYWRRYWVEFTITCQIASDRANYLGTKDI